MENNAKPESSALQISSKIIPDLSWKTAMYEPLIQTFTTKFHRYSGQNSSNLYLPFKFSLQVYV